jgi:four helix bundle protein
MKSIKVGKFEEIQVWKKSKDLTLKIYRLFSNCKDFGFKDQIQRA